MSVRVEFDDGVHLLVGAGADVELANRFLAHLSVRGFAPATRRAYVYDLLNFLRFLDDVGLRLVEIVPTDLFDYLEWQGRRTRPPTLRPAPGRRSWMSRKVADRSP